MRVVEIGVDCNLLTISEFPTIMVEHQRISENRRVFHREMEIISVVSIDRLNIRNNVVNGACFVIA